MSYLSHSFCNAIVTKTLEFALEFHSCKCAKSLEYQGSFKCDIAFIITDVIIIRDKFAHAISKLFPSVLLYREYHYARHFNKRGRFLIRERFLYLPRYCSFRREARLSHRKISKDMTGDNQ